MEDYQEGTRWLLDRISNNFVEIALMLYQGILKSQT